jgi:dTDP-4-dehydrorhamnose 3,5-epimerase
MAISLEDFIPDQPTVGLIEPARRAAVPDPHLIDGVVLVSLSSGADGRGALNELLTLRDELQEPIVHVYQVQCAPKSVRAWVYHRHQTDRLAFTSGEFRVVLYDLRPASPTFEKLNVFDLGAARRCRLHIPPFVVHGVQSRGSTMASFVNMPTNIYYPDRPDKLRLAWDHPGIPYRFADD